MSKVYTFFVLPIKVVILYRFKYILFGLPACLFIASSFILAERNRRDDSALFNALHKLLQILIYFHLKRMLGKVVYFRNS